MTSTIIAAITTAAHKVVMETPSKNGQENLQSTGFSIIQDQL